MKFGERFKIDREKLKFGQKEYQDRDNPEKHICSIKTIQRIEQENKIPKDDILKKLANKNNQDEKEYLQYSNNKKSSVGSESPIMKFFQVIKPEAIYETLSRGGVFQFEYSHQINSGEQFNCMYNFKRKVLELQKGRESYPGVMTSSSKDDWCEQLGYSLAELKKYKMGVFYKAILAHSEYGTPLYSLSGNREENLRHIYFVWPLDDSSWRITHLPQNEFNLIQGDLCLNIHEHELLEIFNSNFQDRSQYKKLEYSESDEFKTVLDSYQKYRMGEQLGFLYEFCKYKLENNEDPSINEDDFFGEFIYSHLFTTYQKNSTVHIHGNHDAKDFRTYWIWESLKEIPPFLYSFKTKQDQEETIKKINNLIDKKDERVCNEAFQYFNKGKEKAIDVINAFQIKNKIISYDEDEDYNIYYEDYLREEKDIADSMDNLPF